MVHFSEVSEFHEPQYSNFEKYIIKLLNPASGSRYAMIDGTFIIVFFVLTFLVIGLILYIRGFRDVLRSLTYYYKHSNFNETFSSKNIYQVTRDPEKIMGAIDFITKRRKDPSEDGFDYESANNRIKEYAEEFRQIEKKSKFETMTKEFQEMKKLKQQNLENNDVHVPKNLKQEKLDQNKDTAEDSNFNDFGESNDELKIQLKETEDEDLDDWFDDESDEDTNNEMKNIGNDIINKNKEIKERYFKLDVKSIDNFKEMEKMNSIFVERTGIAVNDNEYSQPIVDLQKYVQNRRR